MLNRMGLFSSRARRNASSPQGYQSTGLWACCNRYGLVSLLSLLVCLYFPCVFMSDISFSLLACSRLRRSPCRVCFVERCAKRIFPQNKPLFNKRLRCMDTRQAAEHQTSSLFTEEYVVQKDARSESSCTTYSIPRAAPPRENPESPAPLFVALYDMK